MTTNRRDDARDLRENPMPRCSARVRFDSQFQVREKSLGVFVFESRCVEECVENRIRESPYLANQFEGRTLTWVKDRDDTVAEPVSLLLRHAEFASIADDLLRAGHGEAHCTCCAQDYLASVLIANHDGVGPGWRFNRWQCPAGHLLLAAEWAHFMMKTRDVDEG